MGPVCEGSGRLFNAFATPARDGRARRAKGRLWRMLTMRESLGPAPLAENLAPTALPAFLATSVHIFHSMKN